MNYIKVCGLYKTGFQCDGKTPAPGDLSILEITVHHNGNCASVLFREFSGVFILWLQCGYLWHMTSQGSWKVDRSSTISSILLVCITFTREDNRQCVGYILGYI